MSIGAGVAIARKRDYLSGNIYVLLGDGECNEGMIWEAVMFAAHHKLDNLIAIIDYNNFQGLGKNERILNLNSLSKKFQSFGWATKEIDVDNFQELIENISLKDNHEKKPLVVIANTIKGM